LKVLHLVIAVTGKGDLKRVLGSVGQPEEVVFLILIAAGLDGHNRLVHIEQGSGSPPEGNGEFVKFVMLGLGSELESLAVVTPSRDREDFFSNEHR